MQHTARVLNAPDGGGEAAARLVAANGAEGRGRPRARLSALRDRSQKGWAAEALVYNELAQPKGMDPKVVKILHDAFKKGMDEPSYAAVIGKIDQEPFYLNTEDYRAFVRRTVPEQKQLMEELGFKPE